MCAAGTAQEEMKERESKEGASRSEIEDARLSQWVSPL